MFKYSGGAFSRRITRPRHEARFVIRDDDSISATACFHSSRCRRKSLAGDLQPSEFFILMLPSDDNGLGGAEGFD